MEQKHIRLLALRHLKYSPAASPSSVPQFYLTQLEKHLKLYHDDDNFEVTLQPGTRFGLVTCLEAGCSHTVIALDARKDTPDGGKKEGLGSFLRYQLHCRTVQAHGQSRLERVSGQARTPSKPQPSPAVSSVIKTKKPRVSSGGLLSRINEGFGGSPSSSTKAAMPSPSSSLVPRKRPSTVFPIGNVSDEAGPSLSLPSSKRAKSTFSPESSPSRGFAEVKLNSSPPARLIAPSAVQNLGTIQRLETKITSIDSTLKIYYPIIQGLKRRLRDKGKLTKPQTNRLKSTEALIKEKEDEKALCTQQLEVARGAAPVPPLAFVKAEVEDVKPYPWPAAGPSGDVKPDIKPDIKPNVFASGAASLSVAGSSRAVDPSSDIKPQFGQYREPSNGAPSDVEMEDGDAMLGRIARKVRVGGGNLDDFITAASGATFDDNATVENALKRLGLPDLGTRLPGMAIRLLPHQALGVAWMLDRENHRERGGILADEMGLGKTVQTIATMTQNMSDDPAVKSTLILAPLCLLTQWKEEIETRTDGDLFNVCVYHGPNRPKTKKALQKFDVVITTYHTLMAEWPDYAGIEKAKAKKRKKSDFISDDEDDDEPKKKAGLLVTHPWYRIVLDEAQNIRNKDSKQSRSVEDLDSLYRWTLTGTPITNSLCDAYPLLRFLRIRPWYDWTEFREHISRWEVKRGDIASVRLQTIFATVMLRRKKDSLLDGKPLVQLPSKTQEDDVLTLSLEEQQIYDFVQTRSQIVFNRFLRAGTVLKNYHVVLVMLLRLRQICVHPCLIEETADAMRTEEEIEGMKPREELNEELKRARTEISPAFVDAVRAKLQRDMEDRMAAEKESVDATIDDECPICYEPMGSDSIVTQCSHFFCRDCSKGILESDYVEDVDAVQKMAADERPCPTCRGRISPKRIYTRAAFEPMDGGTIDDDSDDDSKPSASSSNKAGKTKIEDIDEELDFTAKRKSRPGRKSNMPSVLASDDDSDDSLDDFIVPDDAEDDEDWGAPKKRKSTRKGKRRVIDSDDEMINASEAEEAEEEEDFVSRVDRKPLALMPKPKPMAKFLPSTKMQKMMELLQEWREESPEDKTIIISQWTGVLDLCSSYLDQNGFDHVLFKGNMSRTKRSAAVADFMKKPDLNVMLMSLKAGGVGLNLTAGSRVISLDPAWSTAVENQAFDRVHRLGQQKPVFIHRLIIDNSVEKRVLDLQERKQRLADGSLGEGTGKKVPRMNVRELAALFGLDAHGDILR